MCTPLNTDISLLPKSLSLINSVNSEESQFGQLRFMSKEEVSTAKEMSPTDLCPYLKLRTATGMFCKNPVLYLLGRPLYFSKF